jgi:hypothetical protein
LVPIGLVVSEEKIFEKAYDVRRRQTPNDGNSSPGPFGPGELKIEVLKWGADGFSYFH